MLLCQCFFELRTRGVQSGQLLLAHSAAARLEGRLIVEQSEGLCKQGVKIAGFHAADGAKPEGREKVVHLYCPNVFFLSDSNSASLRSPFSRNLFSSSSFCVSVVAFLFDCSTFCG